MKDDSEANAAQKEEFAEKGYYTYSGHIILKCKLFLWKIMN